MRRRHCSISPAPPRAPGASGGLTSRSEPSHDPTSPCGCSSRKRTSALPTTTPSATPPPPSPAREWTAEAEHDRSPVRALRRRTAARSCERASRPVTPAAHRIDDPREAPRPRSRARGWGAARTPCRAGAPRTFDPAPASSGGRSVTRTPSHPRRSSRAPARRGRSGGAVEVAEEEQRQVAARTNAASRLRTSTRRVPARSACRWPAGSRTIRSGSENGTPSSSPSTPASSKARAASTVTASEGFRR